MKILPVKQNYFIPFKSQTAYYENRIVEEDAATLENSKSYFYNPVSPQQNIIGFDLIRNDKKTIFIKSRYNHVIGKITHNSDAEIPRINVTASSEQPLVDLIDDDLKLKISLGRGSKFRSKNLNIIYEKVKNDYESSQRKTPVFSDGQARENFAKFKKKYMIKNVEGNVIISSTNLKNSAKKVDKFSSEFAKIAKENPTEFVEKIMKNQGDLKEIFSELVDDFGQENFTKWYLSNDGYYGAYEKYVDKLFKDAKSIDELLKFMPNWAPWKLEEKFWKLNHPQYKYISERYFNYRYSLDIDKNREQAFTIGSLDGFYFSKKSFDELVTKIKHNNLKDAHIKADNLYYNVTRLKGGELNDKFVYLINRSGKKYILKTDRSYAENNNTLGMYDKKVIKKNKVLMADSNFTNACMSRYLDLNGCKNIPRLIYYDFKEDAALYEYVEDVQGDLFQQGKLDTEYSDLNLSNDVVKNLRKKGVFLNDTALKNFFTQDDGTQKIIDLGHANFIMPFKPGVKHYNIEFANINGPDFRTIYASFFE